MPQTVPEDFPFFRNSILTIAFLADMGSRTRSFSEQAIMYLSRNPDFFSTYSRMENNRRISVIENARMPVCFQLPMGRNRGFDPEYS